METRNIKKQGSKKDFREFLRSAGFGNNIKQPYQESSIISNNLIKNLRNVMRKADHKHPVIFYQLPVALLTIIGITGGSVFNDLNGIISKPYLSTAEFVSTLAFIGLGVYVATKKHFT
ncbi:MAG: hypothetical protein M1331_01475 [Candidatus Marsarchaeota archaeon]|nr:hypothetical protein [Candidatus Marsarchaeota archaeon]